ncbi:putative reverse transcriptase domain-containing protein, partial [Tanacetum coccineum]
MRQRRWIKLFSNYECEIRYHPGKANVVADALSRKERLKPRRVRAMAMAIQTGMREKIQAAQSEAFKQENILAEILHGLDQQMEKKEGESLYFMDRIWVPLVGGVRTVIMDEAHKSKYSVHPEADKMYHDLRDMYWWPGMKRDIALFELWILVACLSIGENFRFINKDAFWILVSFMGFKQENILAESLHGLDQQMEKKEGESLYFMDRICVPLVGGVRTVIMDEAHKSKYSVHPEADKM